MEDHVTLIRRMKHDSMVVWLLFMSVRAVIPAAVSLRLATIATLALPSRPFSDQQSTTPSAERVYTYKHRVCGIAYGAASYLFTWPAASGVTRGFWERRGLSSGEKLGNTRLELCGYLPSET